MIKFFRNKFSLLDIHTTEVIVKSASSTLVKIGGMIIGLGVSIFLGRTLGADGLGIINLSNQTATLVIAFCLLGMRQVVIKEVAIGHNRKNWQHIGNVMYSAYWINGIITLLVSVVLILLAPWLSENVFNDSRLTIPLSIAFAVLTPQVFSRIFSSGLIGFHKIWQSNLADQTLSFGVIGVILLFMWIINYEITIITAAIVYAIGRIAVMITLGLYWKSLTRYKGKNKYIGNILLKTALPLLLVTSTAVIASNASTIILGWLVDTKQVGLYTVAARIALLTSFFLQVSNASISPKIAEMYAAGKSREMEKMIQQVTKGLGLIGLFSFLLFVVFGKFILGLWGSEFIEAYWILIILSAGQIVNIATGASGLTLIMCGFEKTQSRISIFSVLLNIPLNIVLIYLYGAMGAALATAISLASENVLKVIYAYKKVGVLTISFFKK